MPHVEADARSIVGVASEWRITLEVLGAASTGVTRITERYVNAEEPPAWMSYRWDLTRPADHVPIELPPVEARIPIEADVVEIGPDR